jgi:hypothetical protein
VCGYRVGAVFERLVCRRRQHVAGGKLSLTRALAVLPMRHDAHNKKGAASGALVRARPSELRADASYARLHEQIVELLAPRRARFQKVSRLCESVLRPRMEKITHAALCYQGPQGGISERPHDCQQIQGNEYFNEIASASHTNSFDAAGREMRRLQAA